MCEHKARAKARILRKSRRGQKPIFQVPWVYIGHISQKFNTQKFAAKPTLSKANFSIAFGIRLLAVYNFKIFDLKLNARLVEEIVDVWSESDVELNIFFRQRCAAVCHAKGDTL